MARAFLTPVLALAVYFTIPFDGRRWIFSAGLGVLATVVAVPYALRRITSIRHAPRPLADAFAVISLLVSLVIVGFSASYYSLSIHTDQFPAIATRVDALYFTVVTIGTVGYGDITPVGQEARLLVSLQIMLNLTLIATVIRLLARAAGDGRHMMPEP